MTRRFTAAGRRARLAVRHRLAPAHRADGPAAAAGVAESLVVLHASDPASVHLSATARMRAGSVAAVERALYDDRSLVRLLCMRRTLFVVPRDLAPVVQAAAAVGLRRPQRALVEKLLREAGEGGADPLAWLADVEDETYAALLGLGGEATAQQLSALVPRLDTTLHLAQGKPYAASQKITSRVLFLLALDGRIVRTRPRGTWISGQHRWSVTEQWLGEPLAELPVAAAQAELLRRWLLAYGPATVADARWWTGLTAREVAAALTAVGVTEVDVDGEPGVVVAGDEEGPGDEDGTAEPWAALLPGLDPTPMGWQRREWYLGEHKPHVFDRNGNVGATVWWDGRIVGGWGQRKDGEVVVRLLEDVGSDAVAAIDAERERLVAHLDGMRVTPRFPAPLDKELAATTS